MLCPSARHIYSPNVLVIPRKLWLHPDMTENLFTGTLSKKQTKKTTPEQQAYPTFTLCSRRPRQPRQSEMSVPCDLVNFCLGTQVLLSIITFRHGLSRYPHKPWAKPLETRRCATFKLTVSNGRLYISSRSVTFSWDLSRFIPLLSRFVTFIKSCQGPLWLAMTAR